MGREAAGEVRHVEAGYHVIGMTAVDALDVAVVEDLESQLCVKL
jgi:hypothetical protein